MCMCDTTSMYVWHGSFIWHVPSAASRCLKIFICVTWLLCSCDKTPLYVWHDSCACVTWLLCMRGMTPLFVWRDSFVCVTWLLCMCVMAHSFGTCLHLSRSAVGDTSHMRMSHVTRSRDSCYTYEWVTSHIWMSHVTHLNASRHT